MIKDASAFALSSLCLYMKIEGARGNKEVMSTSCVRATMPTHVEDSVLDHICRDASVDACDHHPNICESVRQYCGEIGSKLTFVRSMAWSSSSLLCWRSGGSFLWSHCEKNVDDMVDKFRRFERGTEQQSLELMLLRKQRGRASKERAIRARGLSATYISDSGPCDLGCSPLK